MIELQIQRPGSPPISRAFDGETVMVGRREGADIVLDDSSASRRHARLFRRDGRWFVEDLGSRNGTQLNGNTVTGALEIGAGDVVRVGDTVLVVGPSEGARPPAPAPVETLPDDQALFSVLRPATELMQAAGADLEASSHLRLLIEVHRALAAPISRDDLLQLILDRAFAVLKPEHGAIFLVGPGGELYQAAERRSSKSSGALLISRRLAEEVTVKGAAALVVDAQSDERFSSAQSVIISGVRSILAAPLADAEGCLGMIALYSRAHVRRFSEQDLELLVSLASAAAMRVRNIAHVEQAAERRVVDREMALAREIQAGMLRRRALDRDEVEVAARQAPARVVGGDFYEFQVDRDRLWFIVGDVAGKGMAAALMMVMSQTLFRAIATMGRPLDDVMERLNRELAHDNDRAMFVTAIAGHLDLTTGLVTMANAGHNLPYRLRRSGVVETVAATNGLAFGVVEDARFPVTEIVLDPGDALLIYTDGVCDAVNPEGGAFGLAGLEQHLRQVGREPAETIVDGLFKTVEAFAGDAAQEDDITVAVIRYRDPQADEGTARGTAR